MEFALQKTVCASEVKLIRGQLKMKQKDDTRTIEDEAKRTGRADECFC